MHQRWIRSIRQVEMSFASNRIRFADKQCVLLDKFSSGIRSRSTALSSSMITNWFVSLSHPIGSDAAPARQSRPQPLRTVNEIMWLLSYMSILPLFGRIGSSMFYTRIDKSWRRITWTIEWCVNQQLRRSIHRLLVCWPYRCIITLQNFIWSENSQQNKKRLWCCAKVCVNSF